MPQKSRAGQVWFGDGPVRLQRVLAAAGYGSRRSVEDLIETGRVEVDGEVVDRLGSTVDPQTSEIRVDGENLRSAKARYYAVNKPTGVVTTNRDPQGRPRVIDLAPPDQRVFPVGRLDQHSEGLILLTNDGWLSERLAHPRYGVEKIYQVTVAGTPPPDLAKRLERGIYIAEGVIKAKKVRIRATHSRSTEMEITLDEGKNREIRRMLARMGTKVVRLRRIAFGPLRLGDLPLGACRPLTSLEIQKLREAASTRRKKSDETSNEPTRPRRRPAKKVIFTRPQKITESPKSTVIGGDDELPPTRPERPNRTGGPSKGGKSFVRKSSAVGRKTGKSFVSRGKPVTARGGRPAPRGVGAPKRPSGTRGAGGAGGTRAMGSRTGTQRPSAPRSGAPKRGSPRPGSQRPGSQRPQGGKRGPR